MDADALRAIVREELAAAALPPKKPRRKDPRPIITARLFPEELAALDAIAAARGLSRCAIIRECLAPVLGVGIRPRQEMPANFRRRHNHTKPNHYRDLASDERARETAGKRLAALSVERAQILADQTIAAALARPLLDPAMLTDAQGAQSPRKLSRS